MDIADILVAIGVVDDGRFAHFFYLSFKLEFDSGPGLLMKTGI